MNDKYMYSSTSDSNNNSLSINFKKSPQKFAMYTSSKQDNKQVSNNYDNAFTTKSPKQSPSVKKMSEESSSLRQTMSYKKSDSYLTNLTTSQDRHNKFNDFLRQTMNSKTSKSYLDNYDNSSSNSSSREIYIKQNELSQTYKRQNKQLYNFAEKSKSTSSLLNKQRNAFDCQKIAEKLDRNKKLIQELKKTTARTQDDGYLKNIRKNSSPTYIDMDKSYETTDKLFKKKASEQIPYFLTPKVEKRQYQQRFNSSPMIQQQIQNAQNPINTTSLTNIPLQSQQPKPPKKNIKQVKLKHMKSMPYELRLKNHENQESQLPNQVVKKKMFPPKKVVSKDINIKQYSMEEFEIGRKLGQGKFGIVNFVKHKKTQSIFALKKIQKSMIKSHLMIDQLSLQLRIQSSISHKNILSMYGFFDDQTALNILLQYMDEGTLYQKLKKQKTLPQMQSAIIIKQITQAIQYLHDIGVAHRDLKPQNIVMSSNVCKLCDFGWAAICDQRRKTYCGTFDYVAPEILEGSQYDMTVDLWCIGVMTFELLVGKAPFYHISRKETTKKILNAEIQSISYPESVSQNARDFISQMVQKNPNDRMSATNALKHPFLKNAVEQ